jgi:hypothetical protein
MVAYVCLMADLVNFPKSMVRISQDHRKLVLKWLKDFVCHWIITVPSGKQPHNYGKPPFFMGKSTTSMAIFNSFLYVYQRVYAAYVYFPKNSGGFSIFSADFLVFRWTLQQ